MTASPSPDQTPGTLARIHTLRTQRAEQLHGLTQSEMLATAIQITGRYFPKTASKSELLVAILNHESPFPSHPTASAQDAVGQ